MASRHKLQREERKEERKKERKKERKEANTTVSLISRPYSITN